MLCLACDVNEVPLVPLSPDVSRYLDDLKRGVQQMSSWEAATTTKDLTPSTDTVSRMSSWIDPQLATTDSPTTSTVEASLAQEPASNDSEHAPPPVIAAPPPPRAGQAAIIEALKKLHDHMMQQSVDIANLMKRIE